MLEARDLTVLYENALALNRFSLDMRAGEIVGVFGSNGAGKTTLMTTLSGLVLDRRDREGRKGGERITVRGEIRFEGEDVARMVPSERVKRGLVLCRERHPVFRESTVDENLRIAGFLRPWRDLRRGMEDAFTVFPALTPLRRRKAGLLSGGQQQMLSMAMALVARPRLLLLDEPLLGLAPIVQRQIVDALVRIRQADVTVLVAEQYARPIFPIVDRAYVIENGSLVMTGPSRELMDDPNIRSAYLGV